ncbi:MAG: glutathione peroxidase [Hyphomonadaceae bacterium]
MTSLYDFTVKTLDGADKALSDYRGKVLLIVNTASQCGFTPQFAGLEALYRRYRDKGFEVLGFPSNQFGRQEPGDALEIASFCTTNYDVTFPMFAKGDVNGRNAQPHYGFLTRAKRGFLGTRSIKWNFTKFLVARDGKVLARYAPQTEPAQLSVMIENAL